MSGPFRVPEANVFVDDGRWLIMHQLTQYYVAARRDLDGRRFISVERRGTDYPVDLETRAQVLERCLISLIEPTPTKCDKRGCISPIEPTPTKCDKRGCISPAAAPHPCPYKDEIHSDSTTLCTCCEQCQHECAMDI